MMTFFFPNLIPFISFSSLFALASTPGLKGMAKRHPCLATDLRGKVFNFSSLSIMLTIGFLFVTFLSCLGSVLLFHVLLRIFHESVLNFEAIYTTLVFCYQIPTPHTMKKDNNLFHCPFSCLLSECLEKENYF